VVCACALTFAAFGLTQGVEREGMTMVPLKIYFSDRGRGKAALSDCARQEAARHARGGEAAGLGLGKGEVDEGAGVVGLAHNGRN
jgi:hypothetical protein